MIQARLLNYATLYLLIFMNRAIKLVLFESLTYDVSPMRGAACTVSLNLKAFISTIILIQVCIKYQNSIFVVLAYLISLLQARSWIAGKDATRLVCRM